MSDILELLYLGQLKPSAEDVPESDGYRNSHNMMLINEAKLLKLLSDEERVIFEKYKDMSEEAGLFESVHSFSVGFRLGARLVAEAIRL